MERSSILIDKRHLDFNLHYTEKTPKYLCENCRVILGSKQALKHHMVTKHSEKVMTYQCSKCTTTCNRLDNMRCHIKKHAGQTNTPKTCMRLNRCPQSPLGQRDKLRKQRQLLLTQDHTSINLPVPMTTYTSNPSGQTRNQYHGNYYQ